MMQLGFVTAILPDLGLKDILLFAQSEGYQVVEVMCWPVGKAERRYAGVTHLDVSRLSRSQLIEVKELQKSVHVGISGLGYYPNILCSDRREGRVYINHLKKVIKAAQALEIGVVNTFIGADPSKNTDENFRVFRKVWPDLIRFAEDHGVKVGIENCPMFFTDDEWPSGKNLARSPQLWERMFNEIDSANFGLNYDPSHMIWQHMDYLEPIRRFASKFVHCHAKDVRLDQHRLDQVGIMANPAEYHTPKLPGLGDVHWGRFFSTLSDAGYQGPVCVEVEDRAYEGGLELRKESLRQSLRYLHNYMPA